MLGFNVDVKSIELLRECHLRTGICAICSFGNDMLASREPVRTYLV